MTVLARDSESEGDLISWWEGDDPEPTSQVVCGATETVLFIGDDDEVLQWFSPGRHAVEFPEGAAVAFVSNAVTRIEAEGELEDLDDAEMTLVATVRIMHPPKVIRLLEKLSDDESLEGWLGDELMLHAAAASEDADADTLCDQAAERARAVLAEYGVEVLRIDSIEIAQDE